MPASKKYLQPEALRRISRLELRARHIVEGFLSGMHRSPYFGQSIEFLQHREYAPGDDLRHVDWKVWAKQDRYYVKQFEEETNLRGLLLVDVSRSMSYGSGTFTKFEYGATIAASLAYLLLRQHDAAGCVTFDRDVRGETPLRTNQKHLESIVQLLESVQTDDDTDIYGILRRVAEQYPRRGMVTLISDLFVEREPLFRGLRLLRQQGHDVLVFHVLDDDEMEFRFQGPTRFEGLESTARLNCNPRALRQGYLEALEEFLADVRHTCARETVDYALVRTSDSFDSVLAAFLSNRLGMHHRN